MINVKAALDIIKTMSCSINNYGNIFLSSCNVSDLKHITDSAEPCFTLCL